MATEITPPPGISTPAFPVPMWPRQADGQPMSSSEFGLGGMSVRLWLAGQALPAVISIAHHGQWGKGGPEWRDAISDECYRMADLIIKNETIHAAS